MGASTCTTLAFKMFRKKFLKNQKLHCQLVIKGSLQINCQIQALSKSLTLLKASQMELLHLNPHIPKPEPAPEPEPVEEKKEEEAKKEETTEKEEKKEEEKEKADEKKEEKEKETEDKKEDENKASEEKK